ncbi:hypothetical protein EJ04DRAFT_73959 [Polyplosphaeria fusca]|uniref:Uncharacterized protein n=1 Tax=Polyplosphaeria fusca TaxID=682080 RepID=A0A9P4QR28_9PLEO|nr:hypothetical protein EJ04DRAFT_73959 [Polyplosphaeria fusca]
MWYDKASVDNLRGLSSATAIHLLCVLEGRGGSRRAWCRMRFRAGVGGSARAGKQGGAGSASGCGQECVAALRRGSVKTDKCVIKKREARRKLPSAVRDGTQPVGPVAQASSGHRTPARDPATFRKSNPSCRQILLNLPALRSRKGTTGRFERLGGPERRCETASGQSCPPSGSSMCSCLLPARPRAN